MHNKTETWAERANIITVLIANRLPTDEFAVISVTLHQMALIADLGIRIADILLLEKGDPSTEQSTCCCSNATNQNPPNSEPI